MSNKFLLGLVVIVFAFPVPAMAERSLGADVYVPPEIPSALGPFFTDGVISEITGADIYTTTFKVKNLEELAGILPEKLEPVAGAEDVISLVLNRFYADIIKDGQRIEGAATYDEFAVSVPAVFKLSCQSGEQIQSRFISQLYLGSISPESSVVPIMVGQNVYGYPKREAVFDTIGLGEETTTVSVERFGSTIMDATFVKTQRLPVPDSVWSSSERKVPDGFERLGAFLLKAIPAGTSTGYDGRWDVLKLGMTQSITGDALEAWAVEPTFRNGKKLVLDTGRVITIDKILSSTFYRVDGFTPAPNVTLHDYLEPEQPCQE